MKNQIERIKQFVRKHHDPIFYSSGILLGATTTFIVMRKYNGELWVAATPENLQKLIDDPGGALRFDGKITTVYVLNETNPKL